MGVSPEFLTLLTNLPAPVYVTLVRLNNHALSASDKQQKFFDYLCSTAPFYGVQCVPSFAYTTLGPRPVYTLAVKNENFTIELRFQPYQPDRITPEHLGIDFLHADKGRVRFFMNKNWYDNRNPPIVYHATHECLGRSRQVEFSPYDGLFFDVVYELLNDFVNDRPPPIFPPWKNRLLH